MSDGKVAGIIQKIESIQNDIKGGFANQSIFNAECMKRIDELTIRIGEVTTAKKTRAPPKEKSEKVEKTTDVKQPFPGTAMAWFKRNMKNEASFVDQFIDDKLSNDFDKRCDGDDELKQLPDAKKVNARVDLFWKLYCMDKSEFKNIVVIDKIKKAYAEAKKDYEQKNKTPASKE
jgi:hypothetical protein